MLNGRAADARALYPAFDIYVQASESEGLPNAVLEAAACGLPIVATAVGGTTEILTSDIDGVLVPKGDRERLASAIAEVADDPGVARPTGPGRPCPSCRLRPWRPWPRRWRPSIESCSTGSGTARPHDPRRPFGEHRRVELLVEAGDDAEG